ncbi:MAG: 50S ribosomal protein L6, partial [Bacteroidales bacterium]
MSRIGKLPINIPAGVTVTVKGDIVSVKGTKGEMSQKVTGGIAVIVDNGIITVTRPDETKGSRALHGLYRSLINNLVIGVSNGYKKEMELVGVGYRAEGNGQVLKLSLGYSHDTYIRLPKEVKLETKSERNKNPLILLESCDKELLGLICAKVRSYREPEPYKGKGVRYS